MSFSAVRHSTCLVRRISLRTRCDRQPSTFSVTYTASRALHSSRDNNTPSSSSTQPQPRRIVTTTQQAQPSPVPGSIGMPVRKPPLSSRFAAKKAALTLTPRAVERLRVMLSDPNSPQYLKVGTKKKGCSGLSYDLEYISAPARFDEVIEQDGVKVVVDAKALFSLIGSEMDYVDDVLQSTFVFNNPNVKEMCGCGESFMV